ncbi:DUF3800 domain-containing protein [Agrobacterium sp. LAD9]|uniref:DUF3800 domain-containing protein n=1 Tax=Agrobacterium sp. LAD9 TaxID=2055153 RepID=UPI000D1DB01C|nr:DUF3800 domain-containing protein [Agrobacterium sp. LAD9]
MIKTDSFRDLEIRLHGLDKANVPYKLFYDETNNHRKLHVTANGLNVEDPGCFVLAGVALHKGSPDPDIQELRRLLALQPTTGEIKLSHIGKGDLLSLLRSKRLGTFLDWIEATGLYIHYHCLDQLYWSIVDIVDSAIMGGHRPDLIPFVPALKDTLNTALRIDFDTAISLFRALNYPALDPKDGKQFYEGLRTILLRQARQLNPIYGQMLDTLFESAGHGTEFPFIEGVPDDAHVLIEGFDIFFRHRLTILSKSEHVLDIEEVIREKFETLPVPADINFQFSDSKCEPLIQVSDVVAGLLGKFFNYLVLSDAAKIKSDLQALDDRQRSNLSKIGSHLTKSATENKAFAHRVVSLTDMAKTDLLFP